VVYYFPPPLCMICSVLRSLPNVVSLPQLMAERPLDKRFTESTYFISISDTINPDTSHQQLLDTTEGRGGRANATRTPRTTGASAAGVRMDAACCVFYCSSYANGKGTRLSSICSAAFENRALLMVFCLSPSHESSIKRTKM